MELVRGRSGAEILRDEGVLSVPRRAVESWPRPAAAWSTRTATASCTDDVKPGNLLRGEDGVVKLADFGIAKRSATSPRSRRWARCSHRGYLAPEQAAGEQAGPAADLYALGVVAYS